MARQWISPEASSLCVFTGEADPVVAITVLARELLDDAGFDEPPFSPAILASFRDVIGIRLASMRSAARLRPDRGALVIEVNRDHSRGKQNFSADHEIIHTLLPTYGNRWIDDSETGTFPNNSEEELLCDIGAAELLLDARRLRPHAEEAGPSLYSLTRLADLYGASLQATARYIAQLGVWPCAFVFWEKGYRKNERISEGQVLLPGLTQYGGPRPKLRVTNVYASSSFGLYIPKNKSVEDTSLVAACCEGQETLSGMETYDFGHATICLYGEHYYAPYWQRGVFTERVISLLLPPPSRNTQLVTPKQYQIEFL